MTDPSGPPAWIALPSEESIRARTPAGREDPYDFGGVLGMTRLLWAHERIGLPFFRLIHQIMFAPGHLSRGEREMIAAVAAAAQDCHY